MSASGKSLEEHLRPNFNRSITLDFLDAKLSPDNGLLLLCEIDQRHGVTTTIGDALEDGRSAPHTKHSLIQMIWQRVYQMAAECEDCNDAGHGMADPQNRQRRIAHFLPWPALVGTRGLVVSPRTPLRGGAWNGLKRIIQMID